MRQETKIVTKGLIYASIESIRNGLDYASMCLQEHDAALGRTTIKNRTWAETMEKDIRQMEQTLKELREV